MTHDREYYLACWLAGVDPDDIVIRNRQEAAHVVAAYVSCDAKLRIAQRILNQGRF